MRHLLHCQTERCVIQVTAVITPGEGTSAAVFRISQKTNNLILGSKNQTVSECAPLILFQAEGGERKEASGCKSFETEI